MRSFSALLVACLLALTTLLLPTVALGQEDTADTEVVSRPGEVVIDVFDPEIDPNDPELLAAADAIRAENSLRVAALPAAELPDRRAALTTGISITYLSSTPADVRAVVNAAVQDWEAAIKTSGGAVHLTFDWRDLSTSLPGILGFAGPTEFIQRGDGLFYPAALANTLDNTDYVNGAELEVVIASNFYGNTWYVDASNPNVPFNRLDLYATVLHEIGHGLGFLGSAQNGQLKSPPDKYDTLAYVDGVQLLARPNPNSFLTSNNVDITIGGGTFYKLHAPSLFINGSSYSHFDENTYPGGNPGSLMTPALAQGEVERVLDGPTLGVLSESGWPMDIKPISPAITKTVLSLNQVVVDWSLDLGLNGTPPTSFVVQALQGGTVQRSVTVGGAARSATLANLTNGGTYAIKVIPQGKDGSGNAAQTTVSLKVPPGAPLLVNVTGSGLSRTVTWQVPNSGGSPILNYVVDSSKNGAAFTQFGVTATNSIGTGTLSNDVYQFRVRATNANGSSDFGFSLPVGFSSTVVRPLPLDGEIARLYQAYFARLPDSGGMSYNLGLRAAGNPLVDISSGFSVSTEFLNTYGNLGNQQFVEQLYRNVFGREGDAGGVNFWTGQLNAGMSRGEVVLGFSQSLEFVASTQTAGIQTPVQGAVYRLYLAYFLRPPDASGMSYWTTQVTNGTSLAAVSVEFSASSEFVNRYGSLSNAEFVNLVYANVLTRLPDSAGYNFWLSQLNAGVSRGDVMLAFSNSPEFIIRTGSTV